MAMGGSALLLPAVGKMIDIVPAKIIFPISFLIRGALVGQFNLVQDPKSTYCAVIIISVILSSTVQYICVQALLLRNLPNNIRGVMLSTFWFFGNLGTTIFALVGGIMFDKLGRSSPFTLVSITDLTVFVFAIILIFMGKLRNY